MVLLSLTDNLYLSTVTFMRHFQVMISTNDYVTLAKQKNHSLWVDYSACRMWNRKEHLASE